MMPAHIAHVDADGYHTYSNQRFDSIVPGRPSEILGQPVWTILGPETVAKIGFALQSAYADTAA